MSWAMDVPDWGDAAAAGDEHMSAVVFADSKGSHGGKAGSAHRKPSSQPQPQAQARKADKPAKAAVAAAAAPAVTTSG
eukprot:m.87545 g.87545  ORF g.87545 m.87545 type:complete len:78 (+) comp15131_c2_seq2:220-453(+)